ncbi:MAG TPA: NCS2 family permease [Propionibacteriaceae bacterium]|nr:NCS2 family permease [Propionibacteriaceae bacterium]
MVQNSPKAATVPAALPPKRSSLDRYFAISRRGSTIGAEIRGGVVTFVTMAYIIALNPLIIGTVPDINGNLVSGLPFKVDGVVSGANIGATIGMVAAATALVGAIMTILMGVWARFPIGLATGLGINALLAASLVLKMTWAQAMGLVVWEGILITILVLTGFRKAVFKAVPHSLRIAISVGIGLFIALIGLKDSGFVRSGTGVPVTLGINGNLLGLPTLVFCIGLVLLIMLYVRKVKGAMLISVVGMTIVAVIIEALVHNGPYNDGVNIHPTGWQLNVPAITGKLWDLPNLHLLFRVDMFGAFKGGPTVVLSVLLTIFALLLSDFFDTMGTIFAIGSEGGLLDKNGNPPYMQQILVVDSLAAIAGGLGSVSSNTSYIESASGVGEGARTGLASVVTGIGFLVALLLAPLVNLVPSEAAAPVLVLVGFLMMQQVAELDWRDLEESIPAYATIVLMPFTYSITNGIGAGFLLFAILKLARGKAKEVHPLMWVIAVLFFLYFAQGVILHWMGLS